MARGVPKKADVGALLQAGFEKALIAQQPLAVANVERLRRVHPNKSPKELIKYLNKVYLGAVTTTGAAAGATAIIPGDLPLSIPAAVADMLAFTEASVLYALSVAEIHGLHPEDIERRRLLVTLVLLGDAGTKGLDAVIGRSGAHWAKKIVQAIPMDAINAANKILGPRFVTKYGSKQGVLVLGKQVPLGIGAGLGGGGNAFFGWGVIKAAAKMFGEPPKKWPKPTDEDSGATNSAET